MKNETDTISPACRRRLHAQGYDRYTDQELTEYKFGIRFAYALCTTLVVLGLVFASIPLLSVAAVIAFLGIFPPYHPFDYLYNYVVRHLLNKPKLPPRTNQGRFACGIASIWLTITILLFYYQQHIAAYVLGGMLVSVATLVTTTDFCIPSVVYNFLFRNKKALT